MSTAPRSRFLDLRALAALEHMRFSTRRRIEGSYSGFHKSRQQGGAGEFVDFLAIDVSGSMRFGGRDGRSGEGSKLEYVQYLATALAYVISRGQDQVGLAVLDERLREVFPPGATTPHLSRMLEAIESLVTRSTQRMAAGLRELFECSRRRGVLLVMSDFLMDDLEDVFATLRLFRQSGWGVVALHLVHPGEERLPDGLAYRFEGMEDDGWIWCSPAEIRATYQERFQSHLAMVRQLTLAGGCDYRRVSTATGYLHTLGGFLVERAG